MEICITSSSGKPSSVAIMVAFSSALSIVSNEESSVYETRCSVMAMDEASQREKDLHGDTAFPGAAAGTRQKRLPANAVVCLPDGETGNVPRGGRGLMICRRDFDVGPKLKRA